MNITEIINYEPYRVAFTKALFTLAEDPEIGVVLTASQTYDILATIGSVGSDEAIFHAIVVEIASENPDHPILAAKIGERGLMVYGHKISFIKFDGVDDKTGEPFVNHQVGLFGSMLPEGIRLQVETEKVGSGDKEYLRPIAVLLRDYKNAKGKMQTARLAFGILDTVKALKIEYRDWVRQALDCGNDEDELVERGLMGEWSEPKLGSGGGDRVKLVELGYNAMEFGPQSYEVVGVRYEAKEDTRSTYAQVGFDLELDGTVVSTWSEVAFVLEKSRDRGGIGYSPMVGDALKCGVKYYLHVLGTKPKMKWDKELKKDVLYHDRDGNTWETIDAVLSPQAAINPRLLRKAPTPAVLAAAQVVTALPMKSASLSQVEVEADFDDIPF